jgi:putative IMPACT (imprinted ancient) family translation regulator
LRREYHDATHVAFAWKIGSGDVARARASDDGEPSGTAGKPIALAIEAAGLTDVLVAIVRYFGGIKLGTAGLARAYREAAARALSKAGSRLLQETVRVIVTCRYESASAVRRLLRPPEVTLLEERFGSDCLFGILVQASRLPSLTRALQAARLAYEVKSTEGGPKTKV